MFPSRAWSFVAVLLVWSSFYSLLVAANDLTTHQNEVNALLEIKKSLIDVKNSLSTWNQGDPCKSKWVGVLCSETAMEDGHLHVIQLYLLNKNLSGNLSVELGRLSYLEILDFMWNNISGSIPKEIGNIKPLRLLLLSGNQLTGTLPEELGYLPNLDRIQIDENQISGPLPESFVNLTKTRHFHMNNNQINGQIPAVLFRLPSLIHFLLDNNNLSGQLPPEFSRMQNLTILQLDNNNFGGTTIPDSYSSMSELSKLSLRNCSLRGPIPDLSRIPILYYVDLSSNQLDGFIPPDRLSRYITTIDISNNNLTGTIPANFSDLPDLQKLILANNSLSGSIPSSIWQSRNSDATERLTIDLENNNLTSISGSFDLPANVTLRLRGNPLCSNTTLASFCGSQRGDDDESGMIRSTNSTHECRQCRSPFESIQASPYSCFCAAPLRVGHRLKSPGLSYFLPYRTRFKDYMIEELKLQSYQLEIESYEWQTGPRLEMVLKIFPTYDANNLASSIFNASEAKRIEDKFTTWTIKDNPQFGPREFLHSTLYVPASHKGALSTGALVGIILAGIAAAVTLSAIISLLIIRVKLRGYRVLSKRSRVGQHSHSMNFMKINGVKSFTYGEMALATNNFSSSAQIGQGGYGKVYKGILDDGTVVAIKRAQDGSLQGQREFLTEIEFLSRLHHRNLVSLVGYCDEEGEQMLVYEFMSRGTLRDQLSGRSKEPLGFAIRLSIAMASAKGILYLHTEADPPVIHRDIKSTNILLDHKFTAKVADFGLSKLAPVPNTQGIVPAYVSTLVKGTPGYLDPEYFQTYQLTNKSDVYSLGVVFLELLTGMQPISDRKNIVREVTTAYQSGMIASVIDGRMSSYPPECVEKFVTLALKCCKEETESRPSMAEVSRELENIWLSMPKSDIRITEFITSSDHTSAVDQPSSSSSSSTQNFSYSNTFGGVISTIPPR